MEFKNTLYDKREGIATITINRPQALNALTEETVLEGFTVEGALSGPVLRGLHYEPVRSSGPGGHGAT